VDRRYGPSSPGAHDLTIRRTETPDAHRAGYEELQVLTELIEAGKITPVVDRTYTLSEAADAIRYLDEGRARGKVVITV
jgi:NADPH:quinone reductase-like Zn-dependent oxidoreductase